MSPEPTIETDLPGSADQSIVQVGTHGDVPTDATRHAQRVVEKLFHVAHRPVLSARVRLSRHGDRAVERPVIAQANLDVSGHMVRAQADGRTADEAIDRMEDRLRRRLAGLAEGWEAWRGRAGSDEPHEWRHGAAPSRPLPWFPRPPEERTIARRKSFAPRTGTVDDAARDMGLLGYDFHLFVEAGSRRDSVLYRAGDTGFRLAQTEPPVPHELALFELPVSISAQPAPELTEDEARERLELLGLPFLFFLHLGLGRGAVLYHRYDGHFGLLTPAT